MTIETLSRRKVHKLPLENKAAVNSVEVREVEVALQHRESSTRVNSNRKPGFEKATLLKQRHIETFAESL
jgi:hypothetical protein